MADVTGNIEGEDLLFVGAEQVDFRLQPRSPAIGAGAANGAPDVVGEILMDTR
jgi:hypothetical protein